MNHRLTEKVKYIHKVVLITQDEKILILQRDPSSITRPKKWDLPGGNSEWPTHLQPDKKTVVHRYLHLQDVRREVLEETGLDISHQIDQLKLVSLDTTYEPAKDAFSILVGWSLKMEKQAKDYAIVLSGEHTNYKWINPQESLSIDFGFAGGLDGYITHIIQQTFKH